MMQKQVKTAVKKMTSPEQAYDACDYFTDDVYQPGLVLGKFIIFFGFCFSKVSFLNYVVEMIKLMHLDIVLKHVKLF